MNTTDFFEKGIALMQAVRVKKPIVHHLTNYVTVNDCANVVLAMGASPIMADEAGEVEQIVDLSSALLLNIGTANERTLASMVMAAKAADEKKIPIILDPVGAGASTFRTVAVKRLLASTTPTVLRGNLSEIKCIAGLCSTTSGVDASAADSEGGKEAAIEVAKQLASELGCIVAITGKIDVISDGGHCIIIENGTSRLSEVTGTGCMTTSLVASLCAEADDFLVATAMGILIMCLAGELSQQEKGLGSFHQALIDNISTMDGAIITGRGKVNVH